MTVSVEEARDRLDALIAHLEPGEQVVIVRDNVPVATLTRSPLGEWPCTAGSAEHREHSMSPDFDSPLDDFEEYTD